MALNQGMMRIGMRAATVGAVLLALWSLASDTARAQLAPEAAPTRPLRARAVLKLANDNYSRGDYETAAQFYAQTQTLQKELNATERRDLDTAIRRNNVALQGRRDGKILIVKAEEALQQGRNGEAADLLKKVTANQYLAPDDQKALSKLNDRVRGIAYTKMQGPPRNAKALLGEARQALQRGDLDQAEMLAHQAEHTKGWVMPWSDSPAKVLRDVQLARRQAPLKETKTEIVVGPRKEPPSFFGAVRKVFRPRENPPFPPDGPDGPVLPPTNAEAPPRQKTSDNKNSQESSGAFQTVKNLFSWPPTLMAKDAGPQEAKAKEPKAKQANPALPPASKEGPGALETVKNFFCWPNGAAKEVKPEAIAKNIPNDPQPCNVCSDSLPPPQTAKNNYFPAPPKEVVVIQNPPAGTIPAMNPVLAQKPAAEAAVVVAQRAEEKPLLPPVPAVNNNKESARQLIKQGYKALQSNDFDTARKLAFQAKDLRPDLDWWEQNPDRLLADVQRRAPKAPAGVVPAGVVPVAAKEVVATAKPAPNEKADNDKKDARALLTQARTLIRQEKIDEAEKLCVQAQAIPGTHWGLFEDSPEKLRVDIQKSRSHRDRDESTRLMVEARKLFTQANYPDAKSKAWRAQQLHGPYNIWDLGDRPQKLLAEIERVEMDQRKSKSTDPRDAKPRDQVASNNPPGTGPAQKTLPPPEPSAAGEAKTRAAALVAEARDFQKKGMLVEARQRALAAQQLGAAFTPQDDGPQAVLQELGWLSNKQIEALLQRAGETVGNLNDPIRFQKAEADLNAARNLAAAFGQDFNRIDQRIASLRQVQQTQVAGIGAPPPLQNNAPPGNAPINPLGQSKLDQARMELKAGNTHLARRLAEEAFDPRLGVQQEAAAVLRSIDVEEHNQKILAAHRNAEAGLDAFKRHDFEQARSILGTVDLRLLNAEQQRLIREVAANPQMQPREGPYKGGKEIVQVAALPNAAGKAKVEDRPGADSDLNNFRAMEEIVFQKLRTQSLAAQGKAIEHTKAGETAQAIEVLKEYLDQLGRSQLDPDRMALLSRPIENRVQQYRTLQAQLTIEKARVELDKTGDWKESDYQRSILKGQDDVVDMMKQYRAFMKEGKYKEARLAALKAKELDPDNVAADAGIRIASIESAQKEHDAIRDENEGMFLHELDNKMGPHVDITDPLRFDKERALKNRQNRSNLGNGIPTLNHNAIERDIESKLSRPISLNFKETPLKQAIEVLQTMSGVNVVPDQAALQEASVSLDQPLSLMVENISLKSALSLLLKQVHLTYVIKEEVLQITTENYARGKLKQITYPVADLVVPVENQNLPDVNNLQATLERHIASTSGVMSPGMTPIPGPMSLPNGQMVSSASSGMSAMQTPMSTGPQSSTNRQSRQTIEDLLINLITNTVSPDTWNSVGGPGTIQYFPLGMSLVINQTQDVQEQVQDLLAALRRLQDLEVSIEMRLVSVSESFFEYIGVNFDVNLLTKNSPSVQTQLLTSQFQPFGNVNNFAPSNFVSGLTPANTFTPDLNIPLKSSSFGFAAPPFGGFPGTLGADGGLSLGLAFLSDIQVFMFMEAAQGDRRTNVMQAPKITVFNGQTAFITVQDQQFFLFGVTLNQSQFGQIFFSPQNTPVPLGVALRVTPVVSADRRFVRMNLSPSMTNLASTNVPLIPVQIPVPTTVFGPGAGTTSGPPGTVFQMFFQQPTFTQIALSTTVNVPDGGTVLLGGLKTLSEGRNEFGPPILSKIPYLSRLFKNVGYGRDAQSLMIMVTPRIIINEEEEQIFLGQLPPIPRP